MLHIVESHNYRRPASPPSATAADIPQELFEDILWHATEGYTECIPSSSDVVRSVTSLALVSWYFADLCRRRLYSQVTLRSAKQLRRMADLLEDERRWMRNPIQTYIKQLLLEPAEEDVPWVHQAGVVLSSRMTAGADHEVLVKPIAEIQLVIHGSPDTPIRRLIMRLRPLPRLLFQDISVLRLSGVQFYSAKDLLYSLSSMHGLRKVMLADVTCGSVPHIGNNTHPRITLSPILESITVCDVSYVVMSAILPVMLKLAFTPKPSLPWDQQHFGSVIEAALILWGKCPPCSWEIIRGSRSAMLQNAALEPDGDEVTNFSKHDFENTTYLKLSDEPNVDAVRQVKHWFEELINDSDVLKATPINIDELAHIVGTDGHAYENLQSFAHDTFEQEKAVLDIDILTFPNPGEPYLKAYRIKLVAWSRGERRGGKMTCKNAIAGEYRCRKFKPRSETMQKMAEKTKVKAMKEFEDLFDDSESDE